MLEILIFIGWVVLCAVAGKIAANKGRSGAGFFWLAFFLTPVVGIAAALVATPDIKAVEGRNIASGGRKCPHCAEIIKREAKVCRFC